MTLKYPKYLEKGMKYGELTIIEVDKGSTFTVNGALKAPSDWKYICKCACPKGIIVSISRRHLTNGHTKSCGCLQGIKNRERLCKINPIEDCGEYIKVFFFNSDRHTNIDKEDYDKICHTCWRERKVTEDLYYATTGSKTERGQQIGLHNIIFPTKEGFIAEHKDGDGLNNRKSNLRSATQSQNTMNQKLREDNSSGVKGVSWDTSRNKWSAKLEVKGKYVLCKRFLNKEDAIKARKEAEETYCGKYSYDNSREIKEEKK